MFANISHSLPSSRNPTTKNGAGSGGIQIMVHCPITIIGDGNTVNMESEEPENSGIVYVPVPVMVRPSHRSTMPMPSPHNSNSTTQRTETTHSQPQTTTPTTSPLIPVAGPKKRKEMDLPATPIDMAPFTKRRRTEDVINISPLPTSSSDLGESAKVKVEECSE